MTGAMTVDRILISAAPGETRIAELSGERLTGLGIHRIGAETRVGDIYLGRVEAVINNLQAAFVDIGEERAGFLALPEVRPKPVGEGEDQISDYLAEGDKVLVQVTRDAEEDKGPKLTTRISLTGRDLVFQPFDSGVSISRRISDAAERARLEAAVGGAGQGEGGFIVRTAAAEAEDDEIADEAARLRARWEAIEAARDQGGKAGCVHRDVAPAFRVLRERGGAELERVIVDDADLLAEMRAFVEIEMPDLLEVLAHHAGATPLFEAEGVEDLIDAALDVYVELPSGANILISETPALTAVDVNTGTADFGGRDRTLIGVNKEAAEEIARQIVLRNLSGLIIIDFVSMRRRDAEQELSDHMARALAADPLKPHLVGFTRLGLAEITRRRQGASLQEIMCGEPVAPLLSPESTALAALRAALAEGRAAPKPSYRIHVAAPVADALLNEFEDALAETAGKLGGSLDVVTDASVGPDGFRIEGGAPGKAS
jgi:ribonuclease G